MSDNKFVIDISKSVNLIFNNLLKIILITLLTVFAGFIYINQKEKPVEYYQVEANVEPISIFDELKYESYNNQVEVNKRYVSGAFKKIDSKFLYKLFIGKLNVDGKMIFMESAKRSGLIKKENYENENEYNDAINNFISSININYSSETENIGSGNRRNKIYFKISNPNTSTLDNFLNQIEILTNLEVNRFIRNNFDYIVEVENKINEELKLSPASTEYESFLLPLSAEKIPLDVIRDYYLTVTEEGKQNLFIRKNNALKTIINLINSTPIIKKNEFLAAKITKNRDQIKLIKLLPKENLTDIQILFSSVVFGASLGVFYVLLINNFFRKKQSNI